MRQTLFALAAATSLLAAGETGCWFHGDASAAPRVEAKPAVVQRMIEPDPVVETAPLCTCREGGDCTCEVCLCKTLVAQPKPAPVPAAVPIVPAALKTTAAPRGYICGPSGCYPAPAAAPRSYANGSCYGGSCPSYGGGRWFPGKRLVGRFRRR